MKKFFNNKAQTLINLKLKKAKIPKLQKIKFKDYFRNQKNILKLISNSFKNEKIAIRSSFNNEDTNKTSNAGKFESYLNIKSIDYKNIISKINRLSKLKKNSLNEYFFVQNCDGDTEWQALHVACWPLSTCRQQRCVG